MEHLLWAGTRGSCCEVGLTQDWQGRRGLLSKESTAKWVAGGRGCAAKMV